MRKIVACAGLVTGMALPFVSLADPPPPVRRIDMSRLGHDAGRDASSFVVSTTPPDPAPMTAKAQWVYDLRYDKGDIYFIGVHRIELAAPQATPRAMGRFAIELFEGPALIERVRFDFPLLGAGDSLADAGRAALPSFEKKLVTRIGITFPTTTRGTRLELWDRATNLRWPLPWTADAPARRASEAGAPEARGDGGP